MSGEAPGAFRFVHALTRETAYGDLRPGRRAAWHAQVGDALREPPRRATRTWSPRSPTTTPGPRPCSRTWSERGRRARPVGGAGRRAPRCLRGGGEPVDPRRRRRAPRPEPDPRRRHALLLGAASARQRLGDLRGAQAALDEAVALARSLGDHRLMAEAATAFRASGVWHWREMGTTDDDHRRGAAGVPGPRLGPRAAGAAVGQHRAWSGTSATTRRGPTRRAALAGAGPAQRRPRRPAGLSGVALHRAVPAGEVPRARDLRPGVPRARLSRRARDRRRASTSPTRCTARAGPPRRTPPWTAPSRSPRGCGTAAATSRWPGGGGCARPSAATRTPTRSPSTRWPCTDARSVVGLEELTGLTVLERHAGLGSGAGRRGRDGREPAAPVLPHLRRARVGPVRATTSGRCD